jgi:PAS domain S-box-containing protein
MASATGTVSQPRRKAARKRSERAFEEAQAQQSDDILPTAYFDALPRSILITNADLEDPGPTIVYVNAAFERMTGWPAGEAVGRSPRILQGPETDRALMADLKAKLEAGRAWSGETVNYRRDGAAFVVKWSISPVLDQNGRVARFVAIQEDVTERRRDAERRQRLDALVEQVMWAASEGIVITDGDFRILRFGRGAAAMFGWSEDDLSGESLEVLLPERLRRAHAGHVAAFAAGDGQARMMQGRSEVVGCRRDGSEFPARIAIARLGEGPDRRFVAIVRDLTEERRRQAALAESERRFRALFDLSYQFVGLVSPDGVLQEANESALAFIGARIDDVRGRPFLETEWFARAPEAKRVAAEAIEAARAGEFVHGQLELVSHLGEVRTFDFSIRPVFDETGQLAYLIPEGRDVTEMARTSQALAVSESRLRQAQRIARLGNWHWDIASGTLTWSDEAYRIFGVEPQAFTPSYTGFLDTVHPDDRSRVVAAVSGAVAGTRDYRIEHRVVLPDGSLRHVLEQGEVERDPDGLARAMVGIVQDVTERKQYEAALVQAHAKAKEANAAKSRFLATMGHELRTPLNAINGFSEIIANEMFGPLEPSRYRDYGRHILESGRHLLDLIESVLDVTRIESGRLDVREEDVDALDLMKRAVELVAPQAAVDGVEIVLEAVDDLALRIDRRLIRQAVLNLLRNAAKFSPKGEAVRVSARVVAGGTFEIAVVDRGPGIPDALMDRVTLPFVQGDDSLARHHEGSGLGLFLVKSFAELHQGLLDLACPPGGGTVARIVLPAERVLSGVCSEAVAEEAT